MVEGRAPGHKEWLHFAVYADGVDLGNVDAAVKIGMTCRLCERMDCEQRAYPRIQHPLHVDEDVRGISFYASPSEPTG